MTLRAGVATRLRDWRERRGESLRGLATKAGLSWTTLHRIESGATSPNLDTLEALAKALGIRVRDLLPAEGRRQGRR